MQDIDQYELNVFTVIQQIFQSQKDQTFVYITPHKSILMAYTLVIIIIVQFINIIFIIEQHKPLMYFGDGTDKSIQSDNLRLFEIQKQIQNVKKLLQKNQLLASKLREIQSKVTAKIKHNDTLLTSFRYRRVRGEDQKQGIVGISFYKYDIQKQVPHSLEQFWELQTSKQKQNPILKNIYENTPQIQLPPNIVSITKSLKQMVKNYPSNPSSIMFNQVGMFYGVTGLEVYELWRKQKVEPLPKKIPFTPQQNAMLIQMHDKYGDNWRHLSKLSQFRSPDELYYQFNVINSKYKKGRWTNLQNIKLLVLAQYYECPNYHKMAIKHKTRSQGQIRQRYINILHPDKRTQQWTQKQANKLLQLAHKQNYKWAKLSKLFQHKNDNQVWRKFRGMMAQKSCQYIRQNVHDQKVRKTILDYKQDYRIQTKTNID